MSTYAFFSFFQLEHFETHIENMTLKLSVDSFHPAQSQCYADLQRLSLQAYTVD